MPEDRLAKARGTLPEGYQFGAENWRNEKDPERRLAGMNRFYEGAFVRKRAELDRVMAPHFAQMIERLPPHTQSLDDID